MNADECGLIISLGGLFIFQRNTRGPVGLIANNQVKKTLFIWERIDLLLRL